MRAKMVRTAAATLAVAAVLGSAPPAHAAGPPARPSGPAARATALPGLAGLVDGAVRKQLAEDRIPGAAVVVVSGGRTVLAKGYGTADAAGKPVTADTGFFTGSLAKLFTAAAVLQLVDAGKLDLRVDVNRYLTSFKIKDSYPGRPVTLEHLLTYTAGFDDDIVGLAEADPADVGSLARSLADRQPRRVRPPGTRVAYDNYGMALAGHLVEVASGQPFAEYVERHVLKPLGMSSTSVAVPHAARLDAGLAGAYRPAGEGYAIVESQYGPWTPAGTGPITTPADMGRLMLAQLDNDPRLGRDVARRMQRQHYAQNPNIPGMGYAFEQRPRNGHRVAYKDGDIPGHHGVMALLPEQDTGIFVMYNGDGTGTAAPWDGQDLAHQIIDRYFPGKPRATTATQGEDVRRYAGTYRSTRTSRTSIMKVSSLFAAPSVQANADGTLTTTGLSPDPDKAAQHWVRIGPGLFQERGGQARIAFDGNGTLAGSMNPSEAWEKLAWYDDPMPHVVLFGLGALAFLVCFFLLPVMGLARLRPRAGRPPQPAGARAAKLLAWLTAALVTGFTAAVAATVSDPNVLMEITALNAPRLAVLPYVATAGLLSSLAVTVAAVVAWVRGWWGWPGRLSYTLLVLAAVAFFKVAMTYNLLALPFSVN